MGFTEEEFEEVDPAIKRIFTLNNANDGEVLSYRISQATKKYQKHPLDVSSLAVQSKYFYF